ncbi:MAG: dihydroorotate dehydrogenase electron transfer subunit, partial [Hungatella sp.]|nr:dihydroorotate dehydrogenase electron transfer subunit [Hungatella sp.]
MAKVKEIAVVASQTRLGDDVYSMWIKTKEIAGQAEPGQFVDLYTKDGAKLLPRPISICETDKDKGLLRLVYRVVGGG